MAESKNPRTISHQPFAIFPPYCSITGSDPTRFKKQKQKEDRTFLIEKRPAPVPANGSQLIKAKAVS